MTDHENNENETVTGEGSPTGRSGVFGYLSTQPWTTRVLVTLFALVFAYQVWQGMALILFPTDGLQLIRFLSGWVYAAMLVLSIALPMIAFGVALWLGRDRIFWMKGLILLTAASMVPLLSLSLAAIGYRVALAVA